MQSRHVSDWKRLRILFKRWPALYALGEHAADTPLVAALAH